MATINLGAIKFNWKGAYNSGTSYAVDDVVSSGGNSYVCIQAHSNQAVGDATAYWNIMSKAGTNGTDGSNGSAGDTFGLANKEIAFKTNAGALDGIAIGTAGQTLKVNSGATGYEFGSAGKQTQVFVQSYDTVGTVSSNGNFISWNFTPTITGKCLIAHAGNHRAATSSHYYMIYEFNAGSGNVSQHTHGAGYPSSSNTHNQGFGATFMPTGSPGSTPMELQAGTQCTLIVKNDSGASSNQGNDNGNDHIVTAIIFET